MEAKRIKGTQRKQHSTARKRSGRVGGSCQDDKVKQQEYLALLNSTFFERIRGLLSNALNA